MLKKMSKKDVYAGYGIEFKNGKILTPDGEWINELLKEGNSKTGKKVLTWSMLPGTENGGTCVCNCKGCYAMTGFYKMPSVRESLEQNTAIVNNHIEFFTAAIIAQLEYIGQAEVRIHAAGDFNTNNPSEYAKAWHFIAEKNPSCKFWTYTKMPEYETLFDDLQNANIVKSIIPEKGVNFGHCDYIMELYAFLKACGKSVYICRCGIDKNQHCENCGHCSTVNYVLFIEHSTEYKAEEDPLFSELKAIIESQDNSKAA